MVTTRTARQSDLLILKEFEQGIITTERPMDPTLGDDPLSYYDLAELIDSNKSEVVVACDNEIIVGSGYIKIQKAKPYLDHEYYAYIGFMFVIPEYRGKGISRLLLDRLIDWANEQGIHEIRLEVYDQNRGAIGAYEKAGFQKHLIEMRLIR